MLYHVVCVHNIVYKSTHVPGIINTQADALSRQKIELFHAECPDAELNMCRPYLVPTDF